LNAPASRPALADPATTNPEQLWPADVAGLLRQAQDLLDAGRGVDALTLLGRAKSSPWVTNALGVCQLRLGNPAIAVSVFGGLVLAAGGVVIRQDVPAVFRANYAAALFADGNILGGCWALQGAGKEPHPGLDRLRNSLRHWKANLTLWQRIRWALGGQPDCPFVLDEPAGDLA
jgi:hypothetical protein